MEKNIKKTYRLCYEAATVVEKRDSKKYATEREYVEAAILHFAEKNHRTYVEERFILIEQKLKALEEKCNTANSNSSFVDEPFIID